MSTPSLHIVVVGATGRVGRLLAEYAVEGGHRVTAVARDDTKLARLARELASATSATPAMWAAPAGSLRTVTADVLDPGALDVALADADVVLSALAAPSLERPGDTLSRGMRNVVAAVTTVAPRARVLCIAGAGVLDAPGGGLQLDAPEFPAIYRAMSREHAAAWTALRESELSWTVVCPPDMPSGARTRRYRVEAERMPAGGATISAEDVADFMVAEAAAGRYERKRVGVAY